MQTTTCLAVEDLLIITGHSKVERIFSALPSIEASYAQAKQANRKVQKAYDMIHKRIQIAEEAVQIAHMVRFKDFESYRITTGRIGGPV